MFVVALDYPPTESEYLVLWDGLIDHQLTVVCSEILGHCDEVPLHLEMTTIGGH